MDIEAIEEDDLEDKRKIVKKRPGRKKEIKEKENGKSKKPSFQNENKGDFLGFRVRCELFLGQIQMLACSKGKSKAQPTNIRVQSLSWQRLLRSVLLYFQSSLFPIFSPIYGAITLRGNHLF